MPPAIFLVVAVPLLHEELLRARHRVKPISALNDRLGIVPDLGVGVDELAVDIADDRILGLAIRSDAPPPMKGSKYLPKLRGIR